MAKAPFLGYARLIGKGERRMDGIIGFLPLIVLWALVLAPIWRILRRLGYNPWLSLLTLVPIVNLIALWRLAYARWPRAEA